MTLSVGIVGLPNAGKSTLFNAITKSQVPAENFPFCTIEPNKATIFVPDERVQKLSEFFKSQKTLFSTLDFYDIAGIVKNAHNGEGLGNKFLSHIRETDLILFVLRGFENDNIIHTENRVDPKGDLEILKSELLLSDIETLDRKILKTEKEAKGADKKAKELLPKLLELKKFIGDGNFGVPEIFDEKEKKDLQMFVSKKFLVVVNVSEEGLANFSEKNWAEKLQVSEQNILPISAKLEQELSEMSEEDAKIFLKDLGVLETSLERLVRKSFYELGLIQFFTSGEDETRSWTIKKGSKAPVAGGTIHTDFENKFIKAEVISWNDLIELGGFAKAKEVGKLRIEGKDYIVQDGDVMIFKHG
ncbi:MAG: redox-regulated ATPase YchF [Patescibacteria group bacterium]